ncbi:hypothetical protein NDU88_003313 [Pleurodeles waltl]|uniref:Uncharacterized protein n=1 Tax=Pleurodeles waltl TaxID=8319 RepID=A0AAV7TPC3_PLEWA|nr:hypothetical protein NDU88_003313 [Pleurodeles waltl]
MTTSQQGTGTKDRREAVPRRSVGARRPNPAPRIPPEIRPSPTPWERVDNWGSLATGAGVRCSGEELVLISGNLFSFPALRLRHLRKP